jgi:transglutaminase-like putative cysteine protease
MIKWRNSDHKKSANSRITAHYKLFAVIGLIAVLMSFFAGCESLSPGEELYRQAQKSENQKSFTEAAELYARALPLLAEEDTYSAAECSEAMQRLMIFQSLYPYTPDQLEAVIGQVYPQATAERTESWISDKEMEHCVWDGEEHYFSDAVPNLKFRYTDLIRSDPEMDRTYQDLVLGINKNIEEASDNSWMQYQKPAAYRGTHTISIPRDQLPAVGTYRLWFPIPINNGPQTEVTVESITPAEWVKHPPSVDQDIGLVYMEIPMEELAEDLYIQISFTFKHYEQRFNVNPDNVGEYDTNSALYQSYTRSYGNTEITSDIAETAKEIAGDEKNPYLAARKIYYYIIDNIDYSFMPHFVLWPRTPQTESDYVHKYKRGDCGAQSMYFTAMCRSLGIPARTTGGWQLFKEEFSGHFWAEFYLPNYGWIPVDTSCAQLATYPKDLTDEQRQTFIDFYFGNQDSMRCVVQKDTDVPLIPQARNMTLLPMAIQMPAVEYSIPDGVIPDNIFMEYWTMKCEKIDIEF